MNCLEPRIKEARKGNGGKEQPALWTEKARLSHLLSFTPTGALKSQRGQEVEFRSFPFKKQTCFLNSLSLLPIFLE